MVSLRLDLDLLAGLRQVKERDGVAVTEQVRRAIREWLGRKGIPAKTKTKGRA
jgi:propanediol dehydratase large subunit